MSEERLRLVEALTKTDGTMARNNPAELIKSVEILHNYVINGISQPKAEAPVDQTPTPELADEVKVTRSRRKRR